MHKKMARVLDKIVEEIQQIQAIARHNKDATRPRWPMIVLKSPKGWTGPKCVDGVPIEDTFRAHQVPLLIDARHPEHLAQLESWMRSYRPEEPFDEKGRLVAELAELAPQGDRRMGANPHGLSTEAFDALFTRDKPIIFTFLATRLLFINSPIDEPTTAICMFVDTKRMGRSP